MMPAQSQAPSSSSAPSMPSVLPQHVSRSTTQLPASASAPPPISAQPYPSTSTLSHTPINTTNMNMNVTNQAMGGVTPPAGAGTKRPAPPPATTHSQQQQQQQPPRQRQRVVPLSRPQQQQQQQQPIPRQQTAPFVTLANGTTAFPQISVAPNASIETIAAKVTPNANTMATAAPITATAAATVIAATKPPANAIPTISANNIKHKINETDAKLDNTTTTDKNNPAPTPTTTTPPNTNTNTNTTILKPLKREGKNLTEKKIRRLEKNRISARNCRLKKKEVTQNLQQQINALEAENLRLRLQLKIGDEAEASTRQEEERVTKEIDALLKCGAPESQIYTNIEEFKEKFADYGKDARSTIEFHLRNVERLLMPTTTTSIALRALQGGVGGIGSGGGSSSKDVQSESDVGEAKGESRNEANITSNGKDPLSKQSIDVSKDRNDAANIKKEDDSSNVQSPVKLEADKINNTGNSSVDMKVKEAGSQVIQSHQQPQSIPIPPPLTASLSKTGTSLQVQNPQDSEKSTPSLPAPSSTTQTQTPKPIPNQTTSTNAELANLEPKALFQYLVNYLQVTPEQAAFLKDSRHVSKELDDALAKSLGVLEELRERLTQCGEDLEAEHSIIRSILTPRQAGKFLVWVANNGACMHMLNELWSKVYPEPIVGPVSSGEDSAVSNTSTGEGES